MECKIHLELEGGANREEFINFSVHNGRTKRSRKRMQDFVEGQIYPILNAPDIEKATIVIEKRSKL